MPSPLHLIARIAACLSASCLVAGCSSSDARAQRALQAYQAAAAENDIPGARQALLQLVRAKEDVPDYWVELGKLQASTGSYSEAYYAFTRAYELDRGNAELLRAITELALRSGNVSLAKTHARELEVLSPGNTWVKLTDAWAAIRESQFDKALALGDQVLATSPFDPVASLIKARALMGMGRDKEAEEFLTKQVQAQPSDTGSAKLLARFYIRQDDWPRALAVAQKIATQAPNDQQNQLLLIEAAFRSGNVAIAKATSIRLLNAGVSPPFASAVLDLWTSFWLSPDRLQAAKALAASARPDAKSVYARYLSQWGDPGDAIRVMSSSATLPITANSAEPNAVVGEALSRQGQTPAAKSRLDAVIAYDPGNATALRARAELELRTGKAAAAIIDAQKLVTVLPDSADSRLLLARAYAADGQSRWADRTLWAAFQEIPANGKIYAALQQTKKGDGDAARQLLEEYDRQRTAQVTRGML